MLPSLRSVFVLLLLGVGTGGCPLTWRLIAAQVEKGNALDPRLSLLALAGSATAVPGAPTDWFHQAYLKPPNPSNLDRFSFGAVAISGDTVVVGNRNEQSSTTAIINGSDLSSTDNAAGGSGAAYVYVRSGSTWTHQAYLKAPNRSNNDKFGYSVAVSGDTIAVAARKEASTTTGIIHGADLSATNDGGTANGAVYVFVRSGSIWSFQAYLKAPNTSNNDNFGTSLAISGDTIVVGATGEASTTTGVINGNDLSATNDAGNSEGAAYVFRRSGSTWSHEAYLKAPNASALSLFGTSVGISGDTIAVGAMDEPSTTNAIINGSDLSSTNTTGTQNGSVYIFQRSGSSWSHQAYLKAPNNSDTDEFGTWVAIDGDTVAVGGPNEDSKTSAVIHGADLSGADDLGDNTGAVYVFARTGSTWAHQAYLKAPNVFKSTWFGSSVSVYGDTIAVGALGEWSSTVAIINGTDLSGTNLLGASSGAVYVFQRSGLTWSHQSYLKAANASALDNLGDSVALFGDTIVAGAWAEQSSTSAVINGADLSATNDAGNKVGAAYIFMRK